MESVLYPRPNDQRCHWLYDDNVRLFVQCNGNLWVFMCVLPYNPAQSPATMYTWQMLLMGWCVYTNILLSLSLSHTYIYIGTRLSPFASIISTGISNVHIIYPGLKCCARADKSSHHIVGASARSIDPRAPAIDVKIVQLIANARAFEVQKSLGQR